jgi:hypothetical protein
MKHFYSFFSGFFSLGDAFTQRAYTMPKIHTAGFAQDAANLWGDWKTLGGNMREALKHDSSNYRTR